MTKATGTPAAPPGPQAAPAAIAETQQWAERLRREIGKVIVGQETLVHRLLVALVAGGHVLLEGAPGLAKTLVVKSLARACAGSFQRIQFTPDLLPADIVGTLVYDPRTLTFSPHRGPVFANLVLADEINRASAKVQSALLEAMQEHAVTIGSDTHRLPEPFLVLATQNPLEQQGTFPLPEAQLDRFLFHLHVDYPSRDEEVEIVRRQLAGPDVAIQAITSLDDIIRARHSAREVFVDPAILGYAVALVRATRDPKAVGADDAAPLVQAGASPRAAVHFMWAARATALLAGRAFVLPEDVRSVAEDVLRHRLVLSLDAEADGVAAGDVLKRILSRVAAP